MKNITSLFIFILIFALIYLKFGFGVISTIIIFVSILSVLVLIHELGHFFVAKKLGIKVEEFGFGFPPRVFSKKFGETLYSFNLLPIGGFVKLYGEDEAGAGKIKPSATSHKPPADLHRAFFARPIYQRILVVIAGVTMNFILAVTIATYLISSSGFPKEGGNIVITEVAKSSPADVAGIKKGDLVQEINSVSINTVEGLISETKQNLGEEIVIKLKSGNEVKTIEIIPRVNPPKGEGALGIGISPNIIIQRHPFPQSIYYGITRSLTDSVLAVSGFKDLLINIITKVTIPQGVAGPIAMAQLTGEVTKLGPFAILNLMYMLSLSLAVFNVLPIPALDGGRLFFILIEAVTRRKVNSKFEAYAHLVGLVLLLSFLALVSYKDILRIIAGQSILPQ